MTPQDSRTDEFKTLTNEEHVKLRSGMYVGSTTNETIEDWIFDGTSETFKCQSYLFNEGLMKIINEIIDNTIDNTKRTPPTKVIKVSFDGETIAVANDGRSIPVALKDGVYIPTSIFSKMYSGSNFNDDARGNKIGLNGLGCVLTNMFSSSFTVECFDSESGQFFKQTWEDRMTKTKGPKVTKCKSKNFTTKVSFSPKWDLFEWTDKELLSNLIQTRLIFVAATSNQKFKVYFNNKMIKTKNVKQLIGQFQDHGKFLYERVNEKFEYGLIVSKKDEFSCHSFVNHQRTTDPTSSQTRYVTDEITKVATEIVSKKIGQAVNKKLVQQKMHVFTNIFINSPTFSTQTKEKLTTKISSKNYPLDKKQIANALKRCGIIDSLIEELKKSSISQVGKALTATKKRRVQVDKLIDAGFSGTSKSRECMLFVTEGDSALSMVKVGLSKTGRNKIGGFALRGKLINVMSTKDKALSSNEEIKNLVKILGLESSKKYEKESELDSLRYGRIVIMTDADQDGSHIAGLIINFFNKFWPNLIQRHNFVSRFVTPYLKIKHKKTKQQTSFYNMQEFEKFAAENDMSDYTVKLFKGLGTSTREDSIEYFTALDKHLKDIVSNDEKQTNEVISKVFHPKRADDRKTWLMAENNTKPLDYTEKKVPLVQMFETEVFEYSRYSITRAIPSLVDGLKVSQRQIMHTLLNKHPQNKEIKVAQLSAKVALECFYLHGEQSLSGAIVGLAQSFPGKNNFPLLAENGSFGTRDLLGNDAASPRYIFTELREGVLGNIFNKDDLQIVNYRTVEGHVVEPDFFVPSIPLVLINGSNGIATGFRSLIPNFNPLDIIKYIKGKLRNDANLIELKPWYKDFNGTVTRQSKGNWIISGKYKLSKTKLEILEIPVGPSCMSLYKYRKLLDDLVQKNVLKKWIDKSPTENTVKYICNLVKTTGVTDEWIKKTFKLENSVTASCFYLLNEKGVVTKYDGPEHVIDEWLKNKMKYITKRKDFIIKSLSELFEEKLQRLKFVKCVVDGKILIAKKSKAEIASQMTNQGVMAKYHENFLKMHLYSISKERVEELENEVRQIELELEGVKSVSEKQMYMSDLSKLDTNEKKRVRDDSGENLSTKKRK